MTNLSATPNVERLARTILGLERRVRSVEIKPQLAYSSIDDGALKLYINELLSGYFGRLPDGSAGAIIVNRPPPPKPSSLGLTVVPAPGGILVRWDGTFDAGLIPSLDYSRCEVHVSTTSGYTADAFETLVTTFESPRGGEVFIRCLDSARRYVTLVARNTSGTASVQSDEVWGDPLDEVLDTVDIAFSETAPVNPAVGDVWYELPGNVATRWSGTEWVPITDLVALEALDAAFAARDTEIAAAMAAAQNALVSADQAQTVAGQAQISANGKNRVYYENTMPTGGTYIVNDIWFKTDAGFKMHRWTGSIWAVSLMGNDALAVSGIDAGKITVGLMSARRIGTGVLVAGQQIIAGGHDSNGVLLATGNRVITDDTGVKLVKRVSGVDTTTVHLNTGTGDGLFKGRIEAEEGYFKGDLTGSNMGLTGTLTVSGLIRTASSGARVQMGGGNGNFEDIRFYGPTTTLGAGIRAFDGSLRIEGPDYYSAQIHVDGGAAEADQGFYFYTGLNSWVKQSFGTLLDMRTPNGTLSIGPANPQSSHNMTDRNDHYFNKPVSAVGQYTNLSDKRSKKDVEDFEIPVLDKIKKVKARKFRMNHQPAEAPMTLGFFADDLEIFGPGVQVDMLGQLDVTDPLSMEFVPAKGYSVNGMIAVLWVAVQELAAQVDALKPKPASPLVPQVPAPHARSTAP